MAQIFIFFTSILVLPCNGVRWRQQLDQARRSHIIYDPREVSRIIGVPEFPSHLPEAEPIQPGHTLIKPAFGMLKSSIKFPHLDLEDGSGVYGNMENIGLTYDGTHERVLYTGFRRSPADYLMIVPDKNARDQLKPRFKLIPTVVDLNRKKSISDLIRRLRLLNVPGNTKIFMVSDLDRKSQPQSQDISKSFYVSQKDPVNKVDREDKIMLRYRPVKPIRDLYSRSKIREPFQKFQNFQTFEQDRNIIQDRDRDRDLQLRYEEKSSKEEGKMEHDTTKLKLISLWNRKDPYSHITYREDAPDYSTFTPLINRKKLRHWWFFNQDDFGDLERTQNLALRSTI